MQKQNYVKEQMIEYDWQCKGEPSKQIFGLSWDFVPTGLTPSPPEIPTLTEILFPGLP